MRLRLAPVLATGLFVWLGYLVLIPLRFNEVHVYEATLRIQALIGLGVLAYLAHLAFHRRLPGRTALDWAVVGLIAAYALAIALSIYPRYSAEASFTLAAAIFVFYFFSDVDEATPPLMLRGLAAIGIAGAVLGLADILRGLGDWRDLLRAVEGSAGLTDLPPTVPRIEGVGDHVNMLALALNLTLPFALVVALESRSRLERTVMAVGAALILLALFFTLTRSAWASAAVSLPLFALLYWRRDRGLPANVPRPALSRRALAAGAAAAFMALVAGAALLVAGWDSRPEWLFRSSLSPRYDAFDVAFQIAREEPVTGAGPHGFSLLYNSYSGDYPIENFHPHNGYLAVLTDAGVIGVIAVAAVAFVLVSGLVTTYIRAAPYRRAWAAACIAALAALAVHSLADMPNQSKTVLFLVAAIAALSLKAGMRPLPPKRFMSAANLPRLGVLLFVPLFMAGWLWTDQGHSAYDDSLEALAEGRFSAAADLALRAAERDPDFAVYHLHAGVMQAVDWLVSTDQGDPNQERMTGAIASLRRAVELEPRSGLARANLALALRLASQPEAAVEQAHLAMDLAPSDGTIAAVAGLVFESARQFPDAVAAYSRAVTHDSSLIQSPFWTTTPFRQGVRQEVIDGTFLSACQKARVTALYPLYPDDDLGALTAACRREVEAGASDARTLSDLAAAIFRTGPTEEAEALARRAVHQSPDNAYARTTLGFILLDDDETATEARDELLLGAHLGDPDALVLLSIYYGSTVLTPDEEMPDEVVDLIQAALPTAAPFVYDGGIHHYLLGILHYRPRYFRESPTTLLIPSELTAGPNGEPELISARVRFLQAALRALGRPR